MMLHTLAVLRRAIPLALILIVSNLAALAKDGPSLASVVQPYIDDQTLAGAVVLVADHENILTTDAVGWMDLQAKTPMRPDAMFWIASQSKPITGASVMILLDEGKLSLDDPVEKFLPEFKDLWVTTENEKDRKVLTRAAHPITIREILSHTSGLQFKSAIEHPTLDLLPLEYRVRSYSMVPLQFQPGTKSSYSNEGINVAGRIVEVVSGMPFEKFLDERLFQPLGMTDTTFWPNKEQLGRFAKAYKMNSKKDGLEETPIVQLKYPLDDPSRQPMPGGGLFATAKDLSIFYRMLAGGGQFQGKRVLSEKAVQLMTSDQSGEAKSNYGLGIAANDRSYSHGGAYSTNTSYDRQSKLITVFLCQHAGWGDKGKAIIPGVQKAAIEKFSPAGK